MQQLMMIPLVALLSACAQQPTKDPHHIAIYQAKQPVLIPYKIIGQAKVANHDFRGKGKEDADVKHKMQQLAANMGGDALIDIRRLPDGAEGRVIAYQKILL